MDIERWSNGQALIAHGSNCGVSTSEQSNLVLAPCNNVLIFPGVALGTLASGARQVLPGFFTAAAKAVAESMSKESLENGQLVPSVREMREVAIRVANDVAMSAVKEGVSRPCAFSDYKHENDQVRMKRLISGIRWEPEYLPLTAM
jgi:malate dehydrogenase (oxaloacetate-decarboxylating)